MGQIRRLSKLLGTHSGSLVCLMIWCRRSRRRLGVNVVRWRLRHPFPRHRAIISLPAGAYFDFASTEQCRQTSLTKASFIAASAILRHCSAVSAGQSRISSLWTVAIRCASSGSAAEAPRSCATIKPGASVGRIPTKVSVNVRARVTAGLAKEVEAVN